MGVLSSNRRGGWLPTLAGFTLGAIAGCHCWGAIDGCHCWVPLREKIDQSVTPFSAAPFSTLITQKLAYAIWCLCWFNFTSIYFKKLAICDD